METVTRIAPSTDATPDVPALPARSAVVTKQRAIGALRAQLAGLTRRRDELRPQLDAYTTLRADHDRDADEFQALRAKQLLGEAGDPARMRELERHREHLLRKLQEGADEAAALSRAVGSLDRDIGATSAEIAAHAAELPRLLAAAAVELSLDEIVRKRRLRSLMRDLVTVLSECYAGFNAVELLRAQYPNANIPQALTVRQPTDRDELRIPLAVNCPPFDHALASAGVDVMGPMQERALALLAELTAQS